MEQPPHAPWSSGMASVEDVAPHAASPERRGQERAEDAPSPVGAGADAASDVDTSMLDSIERELADVERCLESMDDGTYGYCEVCRRPIDDGDLADSPTARLCRDHLALEGG